MGKKAAKKAGKRAAPVADKALASELYEWVRNNQPLYRMFIANVDNLNRKIKKGVYDPALALKAMENVILASWQDYKAKFYKKGTTARLDAATRRSAASELLDDYDKEWKGKEPPKRGRAKDALVTVPKYGGRSDTPFRVPSADDNAAMLKNLLKAYRKRMIEHLADDTAAVHGRDAVDREKIAAKIDGAIKIITNSL